MSTDSLRCSRPRRPSSVCRPSPKAAARRSTTPSSAQPAPRHVTRSGPSAPGRRRGPRVGGPAGRRSVRQGRGAHPPRRLPRAARGEPDRRTAPRCTGRATRRGQPDRRRPSCGQGGRRGRQGQVDGDPGDRAQRGPGGGRHPRVGDRPRRAHRPARPRPARATSSCRRSTATAARSARSSCARWARWAGPPRRPHRRAGAARRGRAAAPAREVPAGEGGVSGANFAVADTGTLVVVESEGNGRMCLTLPETLISVVGIEKVMPLVGRPRADAPAAPPFEHGGADEPLHDDVDRGPRRRRTAGGARRAPGQRPQPRARRPVGRQALRCIRCSACLNVCPVYERTGGHAYGSVYPGPIGAVLNPQLRGSSGGRQVAALCLSPVWSLLRRVPRADQHPRAPRRAARAGRGAGRAHRRVRRDAGRGLGAVGPQAARRRAEGGGDRGPCRRHAHGPLRARARRLDQRQGPAHATTRVLPTVVGPRTGRGDR
jgi:ferredoxin